MPSAAPFIWRRLHLPAPISPDAARAALIALAGLTGQPRIVLEAIGEKGIITWRIGGDAASVHRAVEALRAHLSDLRSEDAQLLVHDSTQTARLAIRGGRRLPLRSDAVQAVTRGVLSALTIPQGSEQVRLQLVLGPRYRPSRIDDVRPDERLGTRAKFDQFRFGCLLRLGAHAARAERAHRLVDRVADALRGLETPGVRLRLHRTSSSALTSIRSPWRWPLELSIDDLLPLLAWPIATNKAALPGVPAMHPKLLPPTRDLPKHGRVLGVATTNPDRDIAIKTIDSLRGLHVLGPTGTGKSTLLAQLVLQDIEQGRGVLVVDPKSDLVTDILTRMPDHRLDDVVVIDPRDSAPVGLNPLGGGADPDLAADTVLGVIHSLYADAWGPRTQDILHASLLTLARRGDASLVMVPLLLTNPGFRRSIVGAAVKADPLGLGSFWSWYDAISDAERSQAIAPLMNKLRPVLLRPGIRAVLGQRQPKFDISDVFTRKRIVLVSLNKGSIGPEAAQLLGSIVVALLWQAALGRTAIPISQRHPVTVAVDETQDYLRLPGDLSDALAQARGLGVGFLLAHQYLTQLPVPVRDAIMANARSRVAFALSPHDARDIARTTHGELDEADFRTLPVYQAYASLLVDGTTLPWVSLTTQPLPPPTRRARDVQAQSRARYGRPLDAVEADLLSLMTTPTGPAEEKLGRTPRRPADRPSEDAS